MPLETCWHEARPRMRTIHEKRRVLKHNGLVLTCTCYMRGTLIPKYEASAHVKPSGCQSEHVCRPHAHAHN